MFIGDLGFVEGDIIEVLNTGDGNWWTGKLKRNKVIGSFPCNFVEFLEQKVSSEKPIPAAAESAAENGKTPSPSGSAIFNKAAGVSNSNPGSHRASREPSPNPGSQQQPPSPLDHRQSRADFLDGVANELSHHGGSPGRMFEDEDDIVEAPPPIPPSHNSNRSFQDPYYYQDGYRDEDDYYYDDGYMYSDEGDDDRSFDDQRSQDYYPPPPVPPPHHSVSRKGPAQQDQQQPHTPSVGGNSPKTLDRTPSPLRNAMDDLMESLDQMDDNTTRSNSTSVTAVDDYYYGTTNHKHMKTNSSNTINSSFESNSSFNNANTMGRWGKPRPPKNTYSPRTTSPQKPSVMSPPAQKQYEHSDDDDDSKYIPFDPNSYNSLHGGGSSSLSDHDSKPVENPMCLSSSSMRESASGLENSTNSNDSATSAGSLARRKHINDSYYRPSMDSSSNVEPNSIASENAVISEVPVQLPNAKSTNNDSSLINTNSSKPGIKLKRSAGFLKKLFTGDNGNKTEENNAKMTGFGGGGESASSLKRSKSRSSRKSFSSNKSSSFKDRLSKSSSKSLGKSILGDIYSTDDKSVCNNWIEVRRDVHRANTITENERKERKQKRELEGHIVLQPMEKLNQIEGNETVHGTGTWGDGRLDPKNQDFSHVDSTIFAMNSWPRMMSPEAFATSRIGRQFEYELDQLRAIFDFCASKISWEQDYQEEDEEERMNPDNIAAALSRLMQSRRATPRELALCFKVMCDALDIPCDVVTGHLKIPGEIWERPGISPPINHYWNAVIINDEWKIMDASLASSTFPTKDCYYRLEKGVSVNHFYFMASPHQIIYTHVPSMDFDQHIVPTMDPQDAMALPLVGPTAFEHNMKLLDYDSGTTRLNNYEMTELNVSVPHGVDMVAEVQPGNPTTSVFDDTEPAIPGLAQAYWEDNKRYIRVKAFLPDPITQGVLNIYLGDKGTLQAPNKAGLPICYSVGITHAGQNAPFEFVTRHPTPHCERQDIYVTQPQVKKLITGNTYIFSTRQHPAKGITVGAGFARTKIAIQSPSGKITKLYRKGGSEDSVVFGTWENSIKCTELGTWRGLVLADRGNAWSVFAEWYCI